MRGVAEDPPLTIVTLEFDASDAETLAGVLARYVVLTRMVPGCRNVDLCAAAHVSGRFLVVEKWESVEAHRAHLDGEVAVTLARSCAGVLLGPPRIERWYGASAHDLR